MTKFEEAVKILDAWYSRLPLYQDRLPSKGTISGILFVLERLRKKFDLRISKHVSGDEDGTQIIGVSAMSLKEMLAKFGETRKLSAVAGRSNRGARKAVAPFLMAMKTLSLEKIAPKERDEILGMLQQRIVSEYVARYFKVKPVRAIFDQSEITRKFIQTILENAGKSGKAGPVAEYMVGAKLAMKFPKALIRNKRFATADIQSGNLGDFEVGRTVFHVTVAPMEELYTKCYENIQQGRRVYIIVPESVVVGTRQNIELKHLKVAVESIESFVATNIDEKVGFDDGQSLITGLRAFLEKYNERVGETETDKSMLIEIPSNLE